MKGHSRTNSFRFKQFEVAHTKSTLKVGTDAVLLGIYATHPSPNKILDIGTGTGVIALLLAQRFPKVHVLGIDIDAPSIEEANLNFSKSPWADRLKAQQIDLNTFAQKNKSYFDFIVSNPPFFENDLRSPNPKLDKAKHSNTLTYQSLVHAVAHLLSKQGIFSLILPFDKAKHFTEIALIEGLYSSKRLDILPKENKVANRCILEFRKADSSCKKEKLTIYKEDNNYTEEYRLLGKEFYLRF